MVAHETRLRVRYVETDQMGVVHHAAYLVWMELARVEFCRAAGFDYREIELQGGVMLAVVETHCRHLAPARFDDEVKVKVWIQSASPRLVCFGYEMRRAEDDRLLATGDTKHVFCNREMRPVKLPQKYRRLFGIKA
jgi:acyl-CoA thioester hydrolase